MGCLGICREKLGEKRGQKSVRQQAIVDPAHQLSWKGNWILGTGSTNRGRVSLSEKKKEKERGRFISGSSVWEFLFLRFHGALWNTHSLAVTLRGTSSTRHTEQTSFTCNMFFPLSTLSLNKPPPHVHYTLVGQELCFLSLRTANPFPLESFVNMILVNFPLPQSFLVYQVKKGVIRVRYSLAAKTRFRTTSYREG